MRQIKFRAWDKDAGRWMVPDDVYAQLGNQAMWNPEVGEYFILEQFTGLHDSNGKEIYEDDIVEIKRGGLGPIRETITWESNEWCEDGFYSGYLLTFTPDQYTIIGNVHQNPELLEENQ